MSNYISICTLENEVTENEFHNLELSLIMSMTFCLEIPLENKETTESFIAYKEGNEVHMLAHFVRTARDNIQCYYMPGMNKERKIVFEQTLKDLSINKEASRLTVQPGKLQEFISKNTKDAYLAGKEKTRDDLVNNLKIGINQGLGHYPVSDEMIQMMLVTHREGLKANKPMSPEDFNSWSQLFDDGSLQFVEQAAVAYKKAKEKGVVTIKDLEQIFMEIK